ncbi:response regulator transcription factor [Nonomuraea sp. NN258]|uniref:response regulator transcription factor n=1 Tax=Nonomuraea antri TaxID=2730852 RepID=UPI00156A27E4|nr:response regulator transcription factor [Nonomuraea antri]NRQ38104.1 response regulator transcription factor [Nonomuraea antri]
MSRATAAVSPPAQPGGETAARTGPFLLVADPQAELDGLAEHGITVVQCDDGMEALLRIGAEQPDVLLLGADLPGLDAVTLITTLRRRMDLRIIFGVGASDAEIAIKALQAGATACVVKPYRITELLPLLQVPPSAEAPLRVGDVELDAKAHVVRVRGEPVHVPLREFDLLAYLMANAGRVVTRHEISRHVWASSIEPPNNTIAVHIKRLRRRLGDSEKSPRIIHTVRGVGYRYAQPDEPPAEVAGNL